MIRKLLTIALASAAIAGPAAAETTMTLNLAGKSPQAIAAEVHAAAVKVCKAEMRGAALAVYMTAACIEQTVEATLESLTGQTPVTLASAEQTARN